VVAQPQPLHATSSEGCLAACHFKGTASYDIHYTGYLRVLEGYSDLNWISDADKIKATRRYMFTLGGGVILGSLTRIPS
jgi:hypothetical protein